VNHASATSAFAAILSFACAAGAQSFAFPNFANVNDLTMNGDAVQSGSVLRVTDNSPQQTGSVWYSTPVPVIEGFTTEFTFKMTTSTEGLAFVIQESPFGANAIGGDLWGLGYGFGNSGVGISNGIAIEIDSLQQGFLSDSSGNEVSIHTLGSLGNSENEGASIARATAPTDLSNNGVHVMRVSYTPGTFEVFIDNIPTPLLTVPYTIENGGTFAGGGAVSGLGLSGSTAWVGFTATTSTTTNQHSEVLSWNWTSQFVPNPCYEGNVLHGAGGPFDVLTVDNSAGGFYRVERLQVADPWTVEIEPPPGETVAPFVLMGTLGLATAATVTLTPYGTACFPENVLGMGAFMAPHTFSVPPGVRLNLDMTLQAVMATSSANPAQLEMTNAVGVSFVLGPAPTVTAISANSAAVGAAISVTGTNFSPFVELAIDGTPVPVSSSIETLITFLMPPAVPCDSTLRVTNPDGSFAEVAINPTPIITNESNTSGPTFGFTTYIVVGQGFASGSTMTVGGNSANVISSSNTSVIVLTPAGSSGPAQVVITTPGGCQVTSTFTYN
jgi:hypothetical protein